MGGDGDPEMMGPAVDVGDPRLPERFWSKVHSCPMTGCWLWTAALNNGYGIFTVTDAQKRTRNCRSHRVAVEAFDGKIRDGLFVDHLCRVRSCCNPLHLELVTHAENVARSPITAAAVSRDATQCKRGHAFTKENTILCKGRYTAQFERRCRACSNIQKRIYKRQQRKPKASANDAATGGNFRQRCDCCGRFVSFSEFGYGKSGIYRHARCYAERLARDKEEVAMGADGYRETSGRLAEATP